MYHGDGEIDTFFQFPFVEREKRIRFAKKFDRYGIDKAFVRQVIMLRFGDVFLDEKVHE